MRQLNGKKLKQEQKDPLDATSTKENRTKRQKRSILSGEKSLRGPSAGNIRKTKTKIREYSEKFSHVHISFGLLVTGFYSEIREKKGYSTLSSLLPHPVTCHALPWHTLTHQIDLIFEKKKNLLPHMIFTGIYKHLVTFLA